MAGSLRTVRARVAKDLLDLLRMGEVHSERLQSGGGREAGREQNVASTDVDLTLASQLTQDSETMADSICESGPKQTLGSNFTILTHLHCFLLTLGSMSSCHHIPSLFLFPSPSTVLSSANTTEPLTQDASPSSSGAQYSPKGAIG